MTLNAAGRNFVAAVAILLGCATDAAHAAGTRQLATGGATQIEGSAGSGLVPWAVIGGYSTREEISANAFVTRLETDDFGFSAGGVAIGINNRVEFSLARQQLDLDTLGEMAGIPDSLRQDILGVKVRLAGDVIYSRWPQIALGVQYKRMRDFDLPQALGAAEDDGVDVYLSATKVFLGGVADYNTFVTATVRSTDANETGLLGFGGPGEGRSLEFETALGVLLSRRIAVGGEYRTKSSHLDAFGEDDWKSLFVAWFPNRNVSVVLAWVDLGTVAGLSGQSGAYLSVVGGF